MVRIYHSDVYTYIMQRLLMARLIWLSLLSSFCFYFCSSMKPKWPPLNLAGSRRLTAFLITDEAVLQCYLTVAVLICYWCIYRPMLMHTIHKIYRHNLMQKLLS